MLTAFLLFATTISAGIAKPTSPVFKLTSATEKDGLVTLTFQVTNPNLTPLPYLGYTSDSFDPKIPDGTIVPLHKVGLLQGKEWKEYKSGWCGTGIGPVTIPANGKVTFGAQVPIGEWAEIRIGLVWFVSADKKDPQTAWTSAIDRKDVKKEK
jgi:hypothetical protein